MAKSRLSNYYAVYYFCSTAFFVAGVQKNDSSEFQKCYREYESRAYCLKFCFHGDAYISSSEIHSILLYYCLKRS